MREAFVFESVSPPGHLDHTRRVPELPVDCDRYDRGGTRREQLLAMYEMRQRLEHSAVADQPAGTISMAMMRTRVVRRLLELIAALDRRAPQVERPGEAAIARDAADLRARAVKRIEELEREPSSAGPLGPW